MKKDRKKNSFFADFKKFITKGNVLDMAVAVVVATAFNAIVNGLVKYIISPLTSYLTSGASLAELEYVIRGEELAEDGTVLVTKLAVQYGLWIQSIIDFIIIAFSVFLVVRIIKNIERKINAKEIAAKEAEEAKKKAEEEAKAAEAKAIADAAEAKAKAERDEFLENVREQSKLLREIKESLKK